jgi:hypothetical protein
MVIWRSPAIDLVTRKIWTPPAAKRADIDLMLPDIGSALLLLAYVGRLAAALLSLGPSK